MLSSSQLLWFSLALAAMVALVPLSAWLATGSWVQAQRAIRGYGALLGVLLAIVALGGLIGLIAALSS